MASKIWTRDFILSTLAQFSFSFLLFILVPTFPIYLSRMGARGAEIGLLVGSLSVASLVLRLFVGRALLRIPEQKFMIAGAVILTLSFFTYLIATSFWPLLILRLFQGIGMAFFSTASFTLITRISPEDHRAQSLGYFYLAPNVALALAPAFGMFVINHFDFTTFFSLCAILSFCPMIITFRLKKIPPAPVQDGTGRDEPLLSRGAIPPAIMAFSIGIIWGTTTAFFPLFALSQGVDNSGLFFTVLACCLIGVRIFSGKIMDLYSREKVIFPCLISLTIAMTLLSFSRTLPMFILAAVTWGIGNGFLLPTLMAYAVDQAGVSRGPAVATFTAINDLGLGLGPVIMGVILQWSNYRMMFLCLVLTGVINILYFQLFLRKRSVR